MRLIALVRLGPLCMLQYFTGVLHRCFFYKERVDQDMNTKDSLTTAEFSQEWVRLAQTFATAKG